MTNSNDISVVIPTRNRARYVEDLLVSLKISQDRFDGMSEVIVVDDSEPAEASSIQASCQRAGARFLQGTASVRQKRNLGVQEASFPIVLFIDSDCVAQEDLLQQHALTYQNADGSVAGVVGVTEFVGRESWRWEVIRRTQFLNAFSFAHRMEFAPWATCSNTSYRRDILRQANGFDTSFPFRLGGDDLELGIRLGKDGYKLKCNPSAIAYHTRDTWESLSSVWRRAFRWGRMDLHVNYRKHRDRLGLGMPRFSQVFFLLAVSAVIQCALTLTARPLLLPFLWGGGTLVIQGFSTVRMKKGRWRNFFYELAADVLGLAFEFGTLLEGLRRLEPSVIFNTVQRGPVLPGFDQREWVIQGWSMWLAMSLVLAAKALWR
jgi:cellulose synthase/poly-beta-1,6-N-acetylglucosamine synthase-like glycosyltransferase